MPALPGVNVSAAGAGDPQVEGSGGSRKRVRTAGEGRVKDRGDNGTSTGCSHWWQHQSWLSSINVKTSTAWWKLA